MGMEQDDGTLSFALALGEIYFMATDLIAAAAGPTGEIVDAIHQGLLLDAAATESYSAPFIAPRHWNSVNLTWYTYNPTSGDGVVKLGYYMEDLVNGSSLVAETPTPVISTSITCDGSEDEDDLVITQETTDIPITPGGYNVLRVGRLGADAGDTLAADYGLLGVKLTRAS